MTESRRPAASVVPTGQIDDDPPPHQIGELAGHAAFLERPERLALDRDFFGQVLAARAVFLFVVV